jgi:hypothetical protein
VNIWLVHKNDSTGSEPTPMLTPELRPNTHTDPADFARHRLGFTPDENQSRILRSTSKRGIVNCSRQWGKTTVAAAMAVHRAHTVPGSLVLVATPSERQSAELVRKSAAMLRHLGHTPRTDGTNPVSLLFPNGSRIIGIPGQPPAHSASRVRGFSVSLLIVDEAAFMDDETFHALRPMLAATEGDLWMFSTPNGKQGFFHHTWVYGRHWDKFAVPATDCPRISPGFLEEERDALGPVRFQQEYLCEFTERDDALFDQLLIDEAMDPTIPPLIFDW